jgi:hypothetical protein
MAEVNGVDNSSDREGDEITLANFTIEEVIRRPGCWQPFLCRQPQPDKGKVRQTGGKTNRKRHRPDGLNRD